MIGGRGARPLDEASVMFVHHSTKEAFMNTHRKPRNPSRTSAPVKNVSIRLFKGVRWILRQAAQAPDHAARLKRDVVSAWKESARC